MRRRIITLAAALAILLTGNLKYLNRHKMEITLLAPAVMLGIDKPDSTSGDVSASLLLERAGGVEGEGSGDTAGNTEGPMQPVSAGGGTVSAAIEQARKQSARKISLGSVEFFLLGESAIKDDLYRYADFLSKNNELRLVADMYFVRAAAASDVIEAVNKQDSIDTFRVTSKNPAGANGMTFIDFLVRFCEAGSAFAAPAVSLSGNGEAQIQGHAIITNGIFSGYIEPELTRGYNLLMNRQTDSVLEIPDDSGGKAAMVIENTRSRVYFHFAGDTLEKIVIKTLVNTDAQDAGGFVDIRNPATVERIQLEQTRILNEEMDAVLALSREYRSDFLGLGQKLKMKHPYRWERIKNRWPELLTRVPVELQTHTRLRRSFDMIRL